MHQSPHSLYQFTCPTDTTNINGKQAQSALTRLRAVGSLGSLRVEGCQTWLWQYQHWLPCVQFPLDSHSRHSCATLASVGCRWDALCIPGLVLPPAPPCLGMVRLPKVLATPYAACICNNSD